MLSLLRSSGLALSRKPLPFQTAARASRRPLFLSNFRNASSLVAGNVLKKSDAAPRESMEYDVVIVGAGPSGLSAAIKIKQLAQEQSKEVSVCVVEKGAEVGSHILSGNCFNPKALNELFPNWKELGAPLETEIKKDQMFFLTENRAFPVPLPKMMHNDGNYIISLQALVKWLGKQAEQLGVEIYPGFSAAEVLLDDHNQVAGIATSDVGVSKSGEAGDAYARGMELKSKQLLLAEGCRGSLSEMIMKHFDLRKNADPQTYGIGIKEIWEVPAEKCQPGLVQHTIGYPLPTDTYGGTFMYHMAPNKILIGQVVGLDYPNPYLNPYEEFQRFKQHPHIRKFLEGGRCVQYGARALNEGGLQSLPKLTFPGGALVGCSAGFLNVPQVKGSHYAMKSGMVAGESLFAALTSENGPKEVTSYEDALKQTWVYKELHEVRNIHPSFKMGFLPFLVYSGLEMFFLKGRVPWTLHNDKHDWQKTKPAKECKKIEYPKPDGVISFDLLTNLQRSGTNHNEDQPAHLRVKEALKHIPEKVSLQEFAAPETRFCPAKVYEYVGQEEGQPKLVINAQNCVHCKTCDIKTPQNYIQWTVPEGGGGPSYENM